MNAQAYQLKVYTAADGLPDSYVLYSLQDSRGYLWIATHGGLSRFDGMHFHNYDADNGLPSSITTTIFEDHNHQIWIGTTDGPVELLGEKFISYPYKGESNPDYTFSFFETWDDHLYVCTSNGLYQLKNSIWYPQRWKIDNDYGELVAANALGDSSLLLFQRRAIAQLKQGKIDYWDTVSKRDFIRPVLGNNENYKNPDSIYILTNDHLCKIVNDKLIPIFDSWLSNKGNYCYLKDHEGRLWVATDKEGVLIFDHGRIQRIDLKEGLPNRLVDHIDQDQEDNIWLSSTGLVRITPSFIDHLNDSLLLANRISQVYCAKDGKVYIGQSDAGISVFDGSKFISSSKIFTSVNFSGIVMGMTEDDKGAIWISTNAPAIYHFNGKSCTNITSQFKFPPIDTYFSDICYNPNDHFIYLCNHFLFRLRAKNPDTLLRSKHGFMGPPSHMSLDHDNRLWLSISEGTKMVLWNQKQTIIPSEERKTLNEFNQVYTDPNNITWFCSTIHGLSAFEWVDGQPRLEYHITRQNGLPSNNVKNVVVDKDNFLWVVTSNGLARLDLNHHIGGKFPCRIFTADDGYTFKNGSEVRLCSDPRGDIWAGCYDGLIRIHPKNLSLDTVAPRTILEQVKLSGDTSNIDRFATSLSAFSNLPVDLKLPYNENDVSFSYQGITFSHSNELMYSFRLVGLSDQWDSSRLSTASFYHIPPGNFTFEVRTKKPNSGWSNIIQYPFSIEPAFWQTLWFRLISIVAAVAILILVFRARIRQIQKREVAKAEIKTQMQLLEMKALKAQMNPHFIYNAMNSIQSFVMGNEQKNTLKYIAKFGKLLRQILENSDNQRIPLSKELEALRLYIDLEALRFEGEFISDILVEEDIDTETELVPPLILQPYIENALWHGLSKKAGMKKLDVQISIEERFLKCSITDNGIGRKKAEETKSAFSQHASRGLSITESRLNLMGDRGEIPMVVLEDLYENNGCASGTRVIVRIPRVGANRNFIQNMN